jgi:Na+/H+-dicarboxylate symporter
VLQVAEQIAAIMLKVTSYVMLFAPAAVFAALASTVATQGLGVLATFAKFVLGFYGSLAALWAVMLLAAFLFIGKRAFALAWAVRDPVVLAFSTASSEAAYPRTMEVLQRFGVSRKIVSFVLPLGYSFNLDGSMMYCTFASLFIAQVYGVHLSMSQLVLMLFLFLVTSKGMAGVPRASLVVILAALPTFDLPVAGMTLILAVDHLLDMGRSATNVVGNSVASAVIAKWEGQLGPPLDEPQAAEAPPRPA